MKEGQIYSAYDRRREVVADYENEDNLDDFPEFRSVVKGQQLHISISKRETIIVYFSRSETIDGVIFHVKNPGYQRDEREPFSRTDAKMLDSHFQFHALYTGAQESN